MVFKRLSAEERSYVLNDLDNMGFCLARHSEHDDSRVFFAGDRANIGKVQVKRYEDPLLNATDIKERGVMRPLKELFVDCFRIVAALRQQFSDLNGKVFIDLEEHGVYEGTGTRRSRVICFYYSISPFLFKKIIILRKSSACREERTCEIIFLFAVRLTRNPGPATPAPGP